MPPSFPANYNLFMQNKPNLLHTQMNVTTALTTAYQNIKPSRRLKNKPNQTQYCSALEIRTRPTPAGPSANLRPAGPKSIKAERVSSKFYKSPQKPRVFPNFSHYFSHFLSFSRVFAHFHTFSRVFTANQQTY